MKLKIPVFLLLLVGLMGCSSPTELGVLEDSKKANDFSRGFIGNILKGDKEKCIEMIEPIVLNEQIEEIINNTIAKTLNLNLMDSKVVQSSIKGYDDAIIHTIYYQYHFKENYILFKTVVKEVKNKFKIVSFETTYLNTTVDELNPFSFFGKSFRHYFFLFILILVQGFIFFSFIRLLTLKISLKKKIVWSLIILLLNLTRIWIDWDSGIIDFQLLNISLNLSSFFYKPDLISPWFISFNIIPVGSILFWFRKDRMIMEQEDSLEEKREGQ